MILSEGVHAAGFVGKFVSVSPRDEASKTKQKHDVTKPCTQCVFFH